MSIPSNKVIRLNGVDTIAPSSMTVTKSDVDSNTNRDAMGVMHRDRIAIKKKIELTWSGIKSHSDVTKIMKAIEPQTISVTYFDPYEGDWVTKTMYAGDVTAEVYNQANGVPVYKTIKFNLIQC